MGDPDDGSSRSCRLKSQIRWVRRCRGRVWKGKRDRQFLEGRGGGLNMFWPWKFKHAAARCPIDCRTTMDHVGHDGPDRDDVDDVVSCRRSHPIAYVAHGSRLRGSSVLLAGPWPQGCEWRRPYRSTACQMLLSGGQPWLPKLRRCADLECGGRGSG